MSAPLDPPEPLMLTAEVAALFRVDRKTVARWAEAGRLPSIKTLGGHHRFRRADVEAALRGNTPGASS